MKKKYILFTLLIIFILFFSIYVYNKNKVVTVNDISNVNNTNIIKLNLLDGRNGSKILIKDKDKINEFIEYINSYRFKRNSTQEKTIGYIYNVKFYDSNFKNVLEITFTDPLNINGVYYDGVETKPNINEIEEFLFN